MTKTWRRTVRKLRGEQRQVKVRTSAGKEQVRVIGHRNLTDKTAIRQGRSRKKFHYSSTDKGKSRRIK